MITEIYIYQFRNLATTRIAVDAKNVILSGSNGAGKSNILEAIYYSLLGSSFRERHDANIMMIGKEQAAISAKHIIDNYHDVVNIQIEKKNKKIYINGALLRDRKELLLHYPTIIFAYHDLQIVQGEPSYRRQFFDQVASLIYGDQYILLLREYQYILKQRNSALKHEQKEFLEANEEIFIQVNRQLMQMRTNIIEQFNQEFGVRCQNLLGKELFFRYQSSLKGDSAMTIRTFLRTKMPYEYIKKGTLFGIHRDRYLIEKETREMSSYLSIGEKRMITLAMKQTLCQMIYRYRGKKPIILLDDVFVELDRERKVLFWQMMPEYEQLFMSVLAPDEVYFKEESTKLYQVQNGYIQFHEEL
ncbi:DNA replication and repair protein RecF [Entomospira entomophila]|uniref:DNA replication and repair protein RecF n=1 Tax=Entomospira entomophila TaxID=2719988 RepID=A0A968GDE6_9SPIO|nr:DNA replication and repair protein RecF [Entomospira entomophilus]NIZ40384.1 DNA replication/repair protein RecF [Entomospira entomophilus]WDI35943.1 DNA replication and repair protein RecF [Entomospira entomophilus]